MIRQYCADIYKKKITQTHTHTQNRNSTLVAFAVDADIKHKTEEKNL